MVDRGANDTDDILRVELRKIEFTTYGPGRAPVWAVAFALQASSGYEHQCTVIVPGHGHDDVIEVYAKAQAELSRIGKAMAAGVPQPHSGGSEKPLPLELNRRKPGRRSQKTSAGKSG